MFATQSLRSTVPFVLLISIDCPFVVFANWTEDVVFGLQFVIMSNSLFKTPPVSIEVPRYAVLKRKELDPTSVVLSNSGVRLETTTVSELLSDGKKKRSKESCYKKTINWKRLRKYRSFQKSDHHSKTNPSVEFWSTLASLHEKS